MDNTMKILFVGNYIDDSRDNNYLLFAGDHMGDREAMFKKAYTQEYGSKIDDENIDGVYPVLETQDFLGEQDYKIVLELKK